jgi:hypothetical protein
MTKVNCWKKTSRALTLLISLGTAVFWQDDDHKNMREMHSGGFGQEADHF